MSRAHDDAPLDKDAVPCPALIRAAGIIWVVVGGFELLHSVAWSLFVGNKGIVGLPVNCVPCFPSGPAAGWCGGLVGLPYVVAGYRILTGRASDALGYGIASLLLGLFRIAASLVYGLAGTNAQNENVPGALLVLSVIMWVFGTALVVAGALALASRSAYSEWRRSAGLAQYQPPRKRQASEDNPFEE